MPKLSLVTTPAQDIASDIIIVPVDAALTIAEFFPSDITKELLALIQGAKFQGEWGHAKTFIAPKTLNAPFIAVVGMGSKDISDAKRFEAIRRGIATVIMDGRIHSLRDICIEIPNLSVLSAAVEAVLLTDYWFAEHSVAVRRHQATESLQSVTFRVRDAKDIAEGKKIVRRIEETIAAVTLTRNLVNQPASHMSPKVLVEEAKKIKKMSPRISVTIMDKKEAEKKKFSAFLAVARGSKVDPYVIHLKYVPKKKAKKKVVFIGKGITFDSGGLSLKPAEHMEDMKIDMAGAATVLGLFSLLPTLSPDIEVHGIIAACENMPSGDAYRPGDVVVAMNGKTIEILNTDAEGRVTLADALSYAMKLKPDAIVDLATLTGACMVALGDTHAGLFGNTKDLNASLMRAAEDVGEGLVEFPLPEEYRPTVQSKIADLRNTSAMKMGGAITAALFLQEFVEKTPWAHMDIAGPVYAERPLIPYWQFGATGYGVRTLAKLLEELGK